MLVLYVNTISVKYGRIPKNTIFFKNGRKALKSFPLSLSFPFTIFVFLFYNCFLFLFSFKADKISKTIIENQKLPFSFSSIDAGATSHRGERECTIKENGGASEGDEHQ